MARHYRKYSDDDLRKAAAESKSVSEVLRKVGLRPAGGNFANVKKLLQKLEVNCDHFDEEAGRCWNKDARLKDWSQYTRGADLKKHLLKVRGYRCEHCGLTDWLGDYITLELHHIDGDRTNNEIGNLQILCPNCHSQTDNYRNKKKGV